LQHCQEAIEILPCLADKRSPGHGFLFPRRFSDEHHGRALTAPLAQHQRLFLPRPQRREEGLHPLVESFQFAWHGDDSSNFADGNCYDGIVVFSIFLVIAMLPEGFPIALWTPSVHSHVY
jgi:hypothetical protein